MKTSQIAKVIAIIFAFCVIASAEKVIYRDDSWTVSAPERMNCLETPQVTAHGPGDLFDVSHQSVLDHITSGLGPALRLYCPSLVEFVLSNRHTKRLIRLNADSISYAPPQPSNPPVTSAPAQQSSSSTSSGANHGFFIPPTPAMRSAPPPYNPDPQLPSFSFLGANTAAQKCYALSSWNNVVTAGKVNSQTDQMSEADYAEMVKAGFRDDVFVKYIGKPYLQLLPAESEQIFRGMQECTRYSRLRFAFVQYPVRWRAVILEDQQGQNTSFAIQEARDSNDTMLFESNDVLVYAGECFNEAVIAQVVLKKDESYVIGSGNPEYELLFEESIYPALQRYCPNSTQFTIDNFIAGVHIDNRTLEETSTPIGTRERSITTLHITSDASGFHFKRVGQDENSLAEVRATRRAMVARSERSKEIEQQEAANVTAAENVAEDKRKAILEEIAQKAATGSQAEKWYGSMVASRRMPNANLIRNLGTVRLSCAIPAWTGDFASASDIQTTIRESLAKIGLVSDSNSKNLLCLSFAKPVIVTGHGTYKCAGCSVPDYENTKSTFLWAGAEISIPATIRREGRFVRSRAVVALGNGAAGGGELPRHALIDSVSSSIADMVADPGLDKGLQLEDESWIDLLWSLKSREQILYDAFLETVMASHDGASLFADGLQRVRQINYIANAIPSEVVGQQYVPGVWNSRLPAIGILVGPSGAVPTYQPILSHQVFELVVPSSEHFGDTYLIGKASIVEPNCMAKTKDQRVVRVACSVVNSQDSAHPSDAGGDMFQLLNDLVVSSSDQMKAQLGAN